MVPSSPRVSIITPVYNNEDHISECIESVLAQTYQNWDYTIVNNCSADKSAEIARYYAAKDPRIKVYENDQFLPVIANHNHALRQIAPDSKYCKMVFADDWIFPRCVEEMVAVAEKHKSVGFVGAFGLGQVGIGAARRDLVVWTGLPYPSLCVPGRDICRRLFLNGTYVFGTATSLLYRSDLIRARKSFFNEGNIHADAEVCIMLLREHDFGFVHQILSFTRSRSQSLSAVSSDLRTPLAGRLYELVTYGHDFLSDTEYDKSRDQILTEYYNFLAVTLLKGRREKALWEYHRQKLTETVGYRRSLLAQAIISRVVNAVLDPHGTVKKLLGTSGHENVYNGRISDKQAY
jgi:glycosyltransferase involved in cell wall biosynthesis